MSKNIPLCLARRICTIVENSKIKTIKLEELKQILRRQNYPKKIIDTGIEKACKIPIEILRSNKKKTTDKIIPFISTYNPNNCKVLPSIKTVFNNLQQSKTMKDVFQNYRLINSWKQPPNLGRILCKSKFTSVKQSFKVKKCNKKCFCCKDYLLEGTSFQFKKHNSTFDLKANFNCESSNLIYVVICSGCKEEYIGQTGTTLKERVTVYKQHINHPQYQQIKVEAHLRTCGKGNFTIFPFFQVKKEDKSLRESYENHFIKKFEPKLNARQ